jgi:hypothetical protein
VLLFTFVHASGGLQNFDIILMMKIILGAPRHVREAPTALLSRLRRSPVPADLLNSLNSLLDRLQGLHNKADTLEDLLKEGEKFEPRPSGGSFSPVRSKEDAYQISSLPE